jgi:hypothetical protein
MEALFDARADDLPMRSRYSGKSLVESSTGR